MDNSELGALQLIGNVAAVVVAWLLVVLGWAVVAELTGQRERRKAWEARLEAVRTELSSIERLAIEFHCTSFDEEKRSDLVRRLKLLGLECSHLERRTVLTMAWREIVADVRRSSTFDNFLPGSHKPTSVSGELVFHIEQAFDRFRIYLMRAIESKDNEAERLRTTLWRLVKRF